MVRSTPSFSAWTADNRLLLGFFVRSVRTTETAVLLKFQPVRGFLLVLRRRIVSTLTFPARQMNNIPHRLNPIETCSKQAVYFS
jgi:hypothetical protein